MVTWLRDYVVGDEVVAEVEENWTAWIQNGAATTCGALGRGIRRRKCTCGASFMVLGSGIAYRLHRADLPGKPDLVFASRRKVVFVNGCFWHRHPGCPFAYTPKTRVEFWTAKLEGNLKRDLRNLKLLKEMGWKALTVWECETNDSERLKRILKRFLGAAPTTQVPSGIK